MLRRDGRCAGDLGVGAHRHVREFDKDDYLKAVARRRNTSMAGDLMQVQIGQRISKPYVDSPLSLYRALRSLNPSPYMYFYNFGDMQIVGASPEILVRNEERARRRQESHDPSARRHPPARRDARTRCRARRPNCWPTRRKSPNT